MSQTGETLVTDGEQRASSFATCPIIDTLGGTGLADNLAGGRAVFRTFPLSPILLGSLFEQGCMAGTMSEEEKGHVEFPYFVTTSVLDVNPENLLSFITMIITTCSRRAYN